MNIMNNEPSTRIVIENFSDLKHNINNNGRKVEKLFACLYSMLVSQWSLHRLTSY